MSEPSRAGRPPVENQGPFLILLTVLVLAAAVLSLSWGRLSIGWSDLTAGIAALWDGRGLDGLGPESLVFYMVRLPRVILAGLVGAGLSVAGASYQALFRNPLASPDILGVAAGCTVGAALGIILGGNVVLVQGLALVTGLLAVVLVMSIARLVAVRPVLVLVLAGLVVTNLMHAVLMIIKFLADPLNQLPGIVFWLMGSLAKTSWSDVSLTLPVVGGGLLVLHILRYRMNVLSLGDDQAGSLGLNPGLNRAFIVGLSSLMVALSVASCGQVAWVGLVIPHIARTLVGPNHERMLPVSALVGAGFLILCDAVAKGLTSAELPVGVLTAGVGGPVFAYLLYRNRGSGWL